MTAASSGDEPKTRKWVWVAVVVAIVLGVAALGSPGEEGLAFDPSSTSDLGAKGLVQFIDAFGGQVEVVDHVPDKNSDTDVVLLFPGRANPEAESALRKWAGAGHTVVVADPGSELTPGGSQASVAGLSAIRIDQNTCAIDALQPVKSLKVSDTAYRFDVPEGARGCFTRQDQALVVETPELEGQVISLGSPTVLVNENLGEEDNAVLAANLLVPEPGTKVAILQLPFAQRARNKSLRDVMPLGVKLGLLQMSFGFVLYAFFRGRRLGRVIAEPQPVLIAGSELVSAVGNLLQQTRHPARAAAILRGDLRRTLADRLGLPSDASPELVADTAASRSGADPERVRAAVTDYPVNDESSLLAVAKLVDEVREEVLHGRSV